MIRRRVMTWAAALALGGFAADARAAAVTFTGNVETDMPSGNGINNGVYVVPGQAQTAVAQAPWITQNGWTNGWVMKDLRLAYNQATDTMQVGVNFYSIAGDADGNPTNTPSAQTIASGGSDPASLGGRKSISVEFAANSATNAGVPGSPVIVAGVPANKTSAGTGLDGFTVSQAGASSSIQANYGATIPGATGTLAFDPSPAHPDFEFTVKNWSQFSTLAGSKGFWVSAYAGSPDDVVAGEGQIPWIHIPTLGQQTVPEPATVAGWGLMSLGAAWALRRNRRASGRA